MKKFFLYFRFFLKKILQNSLTAYIISLIILLSIKKLSDSKKKKNALKIIVFSHLRWSEGIKVLDRDSEIILYKIPDIIFNYITSFFSAKNLLNYYLQGENYLNKEDKKEKIIFSKPLSLAYFKIKDKEVLNERIRQEKFVRILARNLSFFYKINCGLSCGINYNSEFSWVSGFHNGGIPFVILYKEKSEFNNMSLKTTFINLKKVNFKFLGTAIGVVNKTIKNELEKSKIVPNTHIQDIGLLRFDNILKENRRLNDNKRKGITLFSFSPFSSNIYPEKFTDTLKSNQNIYKKYFSDKNNEGFSKLFLNTHKIFIKLAEKNKNTNFYVKFKFPDYLNDKKCKQLLIDFIKNVTGKDLKKIKNLILTNENSLNLIKKSKNIISFNSTVIIESIAHGVAPIIPAFDEAKGKYSKRVFFKDEKKIIYFANTKNDFINLINLSLKNKIKLIQNRKKVDNFLKKHVNFSKPVARTNTKLFIKRVIENYNKNI